MTAENEAHERAASGLEKAWEGQPVHKIESERLKLIKIHESLITAELHRGRDQRDQILMVETETRII